MNAFPLLRPAAYLFGTASRLRIRSYQAGLRTVENAGHPVISVGNLSAGGTGKTPFVRFLATELLSRGRHPAILTRGYGRSSRGTIVVSSGSGLAVPVTDAGDEAALLAQALPQVPIVADAKRIRGAKRAEEIPVPIDLYLLDDGFSHLQLARNVDIVLLDATEPDGGGEFLPSGRLREPLSSLARADLIVVTKCEQADPARAIALAQDHARGVPVFEASTRVLGIFDSSGETVDPRNLPGETLVAVAGLAHPEAFFDTLDRLGISPMSSLGFPDHARYGDFRIGRILRTAEGTGATALITTEKDAVKLEGRVSLPIFRVAIEMRVEERGFTEEVLSLAERSPS
jgi:tetraacyldisaccharide 4'-kinase